MSESLHHIEQMPTREQQLERCLRDIIYASDGCVGHRECNHSIEPWKRARRLIGAPTWAGCDEEDES